MKKKMEYLYERLLEAEKAHLDFKVENIEILSKYDELTNEVLMIWDLIKTESQEENRKSIHKKILEIELKELDILKDEVKK